VQTSTVLLQTGQGQRRAVQCGEACTQTDYLPGRCLSREEPGRLPPLPTVPRRRGRHPASGLIQPRQGNGTACNDGDAATQTVTCRPASARAESRRLHRLRQVPCGVCATRHRRRSQPHPARQRTHLQDGTACTPGRYLQGRGLPRVRARSRAPPPTSATSRASATLTGTCFRPGQGQRAPDNDGDACTSVTPDRQGT